MGVASGGCPRGEHVVPPPVALKAAVMAADRPMVVPLTEVMSVLAGIFETQVMTSPTFMPVALVTVMEVAPELAVAPMVVVVGYWAKRRVLAEDPEEGVSAVVTFTLLALDQVSLTYVAAPTEAPVPASKAQSVAL